MNNQLSLKICQWNCRGVKGKKFELERYASNWNIFMLIETFLKPGQPGFYIKGFEIIRMDRVDNKRGGIGFLIKKDLIYNRFKF